MNEVNSKNEKSIIDNELYEFSDIMKKNSKKTFIILLVIFIIVLLSLIGVYFLYLTPKSYFNNTLEKLSVLSDTYFNNKFSLFDKEYTTIVANYSTGVTISENVNKISYNLNGNIGYDKNNVYLTGELKDSNEKLLDFNLFTDNLDKLYFDSKYLYDKTLFVDVNLDNNYYNDLININDSLSYISNKIIDSYKNNYDSTKLKKSIENKKIVNKKELTMKITNEMDSKELEIVLGKIIDDLVEDNKSLELISTIVSKEVIYDVSISQVKDLLLKFKDDLKDNSIKMIINYSIFSKEIVYAEIQINDGSIIIKQENEIYYLNIERKSTSNSFVLDIKYSVKDNEYNIIYDSKKLKITLNIKSEKVSDEEYNYQISVEGNSSNILLDYNFITTIKLDEKLETFDVSNSIDINSLTDEEQSIIVNKAYSLLHIY